MIGAASTEAELCDIVEVVERFLARLTSPPPFSGDGDQLGGVARGVAAVWMMIGGGTGLAKTSPVDSVASSLVMVTDGSCWRIRRSAM